MNNNPKWKKPVITRIKLDPSQAILAACAASGAVWASGLAASWPDTAYCVSGVGVPYILPVCGGTKKGVNLTEHHWGTAGVSFDWPS